MTDTEKVNLIKAVINDFYSLTAGQSIEALEAVLAAVLTVTDFGGNNGTI